MLKFNIPPISLAESGRADPEILKPETVRGFWHGSPLSPYQLLSLRSFVDRGYRIELFTYDPEIVVPSWIIRRDANEVWRTNHVLCYQTELGRGSPSLHSNLFRYAMLHMFGGWWVDLDVILLDSALPADEIFFAIENEPNLSVAILKFPRGHQLLLEAVERCVAAGETEPVFGETGPLLFTELVNKYGLAKLAQPAATAYPILGSEVSAPLDPDQREALVNNGAKFIHLYNELWRRSGIPSNLAPPAGSFLEALFEKHRIDAGFASRMEFSNVKRWTAHLFLHEEFQNGLRAYRSALQELGARNEALQAKLRAVERDRDALRPRIFGRVKKCLRITSQRIRSWLD